MRKREPNSGSFTAERLITHGMCYTPEYAAWKDMKRRCYRPTAKNYDRYGGRGISVCERWLNSFANFIADLKRRPSAAHSLERINNNGNYEPGNVMWATNDQQARNTRRNRWVEHGSLRMTVIEWSRHLGVTRFWVRSRLNAGWGIERIIDEVTAQHFRKELAA